MEKELNIEQLTLEITQAPERVEWYVLRGKAYHKMQEWGAALNDFNRALELDPDHQVALSYKEMVLQILAFRHTDLWNP